MSLHSQILLELHLEKEVIYVDCKLRILYSKLTYDQRQGDQLAVHECRLILGVNRTRRQGLCAKSSDMYIFLE